MDKYLQKYLQENFDFKVLKREGFYSKEIKANDYQAQAERICKFFGLKNVYDYSRIGSGVRFHVTEVNQKLSFSESIKNKFGDEILKVISA